MPTAGTQDTQALLPPFPSPRVQSVSPCEDRARCCPQLTITNAYGGKISFMKGWQCHQQGAICRLVIMGGNNH